MDNKKNKRSLWKEFVTGVAATAIGVGLSFAVNNMVENHKKDLARRQTAMMAVYDIDEMVRLMKKDRQTEDNNFKVTMYMATHQDEIADISMDSLRMAASYLIEDLTMIFDWADDTKEKAFNSSMDAWQNLENTKFYDNVQKCYRTRRELLKTMETDMVFKRPLSNDALNDYFMKTKDTDLDFSGSLNQQSLAKLIKKVLKQPLTVRYLRTYFLRNAVFSNCVDNLSRLNQENKFMMDITDKDIEEYVRKNVDKTRPATAKKLVGEWVLSQDENNRQEFSLNSDKTVSLVADVVFSMSLYIEEKNITVSLNCPVTYRIEGEWAVTNDSLKMQFDPKTSIILESDIDLSNLPKATVEQERDSLDTMRNRLQGRILNYIRETDWNISNKVCLDITGDIMFMTARSSNLWGRDEQEQQQLLRKPRR